ncbi:MAG: 16S rRNA (adenine(1518)-N(6)/adenine(1519)-N(6))-dimethyltransferase RsmA [Bacilli bacterium]|jgi:16S rRNA (adenine1518-N6/adenine1519-N6)-dimethyltransferase|nr:16S rRNA (adenine(1518)-N(6)/adenine(1519)-N(6))-dimethyltransferase RsmA [Bacilli bacterium]
MSNIASIKKTKEIMEYFNLNTKKAFGQNFIIDSNIINNIVKKAGLDKDTNVIEIGPGIGALSQFLARECHQLLCIEIDQRLEEVLKYSLSEFTNIKVIFDDFLKIDISKIVKEYFNDNRRLVVVANLPYYITTPILIKLFETSHETKISSIYAMMQKEVGLRLNAHINTKEYNSLSILTNYYTDTKIVMKIPKAIFIPQPQVDSVVVEFIFKNNEYQLLDKELFFNLIRLMFSQRRKTILNNLNNIINDKEATIKILTDLKLNVQLRPENLSIDNYIALSNYLKEHKYYD